MVLADKNKVDDFIKEYLIINSKIKIAKAKIIHAEYENNKFIVLKNKKILHELEQLKEIVESNVKAEYLEKLEIFRVNSKEAIKMFGISKNNLFKLKKEIREEFYKVLDIAEAE